MDTEILQSTTATIPVRLLSATAYAPITGVTAPTVYLHKIGSGSPAAKTITLNANWFELDSTHMPGYYNLVLSATDTNTVGQICVSIKDATTDYFVGLYSIVAANSNVVNTSLGSIDATLTLIRKASFNRTAIIPSNSTYVIYDDDGVTPVKTFKLYDQNNVISSTNVFSRVPQ